MFSLLIGSGTGSLLVLSETEQQQCLLNPKAADFAEPEEPIFSGCGQWALAAAAHQPRKSVRQSFGEGAHSNRTWLLRERAAALQTHSPAGGGYLSHLVHSSGWPIPSTATSTTHGEGHI
ncbi:unnamed protein product [Pleuronectes platessa]|uniref:Uncharacterized protein n=1 Tax=Pleuronectes platessa TaxID=8262 RepID=A0A9N7VS75_PLEPL|nr:unnamed protein product [Pleuronectes platessa]